MSLAAFALVLLQVVAAAPDATPTSTPTSAPTVRPRTLQDIARERRLKTGPDAKGTGTTITLGPAPGVTPASTPSASPAAGGEAPAGDAPPSATDVRVVAVSNDGVVDPAGLVRVSGTVRNGGDQTVCGVAILVRILDSKGNYLASAQTAPDVNVLPARETASFHASVQAPPGVRGGRVNTNRRDVGDGSTTMAGDWTLLGGAEAKVVDASACPK
ncbi:MAG: FxLYD domain-containing protein [Thermoanaerobaculia bacterium]